MGVGTRFNLLLTHGRGSGRTERGDYAQPKPWYETLADVLAPLGVQTYQATTGPTALQVIQDHPIHLAVVDTRISADGLGLLRMLESIRQRALTADYWQSLPTPQKTGATPDASQSFRVQVQWEAGTKANQDVQKMVVRFSARANEASASPPAPPQPSSAVWPTVILVTPPQQDPAVLKEALKFNAFSVMSDPVDLDLLLDVMARAMRRFHHNLWPQ